MNQPRKKSGTTPLCIASMAGSIGLLAEMVSYHLGSVQRVDSYRFKHIIALLIEKGANVNQFDYKGQIPLHYAVQYGKKDIVGLLIDQGANVDQPDHNGAAPLHCATKFGRKEIAALLIDQGANVNQPDYNGATPLHYAAQFRKKDVAALLIERGANVDQSDQNSKVPSADNKHLRFFVCQQASSNDSKPNEFPSSSAHCSN